MNINELFPPSWHEKTENRIAYGSELEKIFAEEWACALCGGKFEFVGNTYKGRPDFRCSSCDHLVDVKRTKRRDGTMPVSAEPWQRYPDDMTLVTRMDGVWIGQVKSEIRTDGAMQTPKHKSAGTHYYNIKTNNFVPLGGLGFIRCT